MKKHFTLLTLIFSVFYIQAQCFTLANVYQFDYNGHTYQLVRENQNWTNAQNCATMQGGYLAEINSAAENAAIFTELNTNAGITTTNTEAPDGGGGAYVWLGANDIATEGTWIWANSNTQFWLGSETGSAVGGLYNNWGTSVGLQNEPDNFTPGQDAMGISLNGWPLGSAGQWNDVADTNILYYLIEYNSILAVEDSSLKQKNTTIYPNPVETVFKIESAKNYTEFSIYDNQGKRIMSKEVSEEINISELDSGIYIIELKEDNGKITTKKLIKK